MNSVQMVFALLLLLAGGYAALAVRRWWAGMQTRKRFRKGRAGEASAIPLLTKHGFEILDDQATRETGLWVDDQWVPVTVRADFLARRGNEKYVVEVKTGDSAPNPANRATRRQLLEYDLVYDVDGVILADMQAGRLYRIRFPDRKNPSSAAAPTAAKFPFAIIAGTLAAGLLLGVLLGLQTGTDRDPPAAVVPAVK